MANERKLWQRLSDKCGDTGRMLLAFILVDLVFKLVIVPAYLDLSVGGDAGPRAKALGQSIEVAGVAVLCLLGTLALVMRPVRRWKAASAESADAIERASVSIHRLPQVIAALWSIEWLVFTAVEMMRQDAVPSRAVIALFLGAMALGPIPIAHGLAVHLLAPVARDVSLRARANGMELEARVVHLRSRLGLYSFCIGVAPTLYMAALVTTVREHPLR
ncbi:MAG TPA: hypothetical protein VM925_35510, partial [Labilithrix sp.]|nr:hypothetical protein [Labilithrix sp.]